MKLLQNILHSKSVLVLMDQVIFSGTNFLLTLFLAKQLDIKNFGLFSTVVLICYLAMSITNALIIQPFQVSYVKISNRKEYFVSLLLGLLILLSILIFLIKLVVLFFPDNNAFKLYSNSLLCFIFGYLFQDFYRKLFLGIDKVVTALVIDVTFLILIMLGFIYFKDNLNLSISLWILGLGNVISSVPGIYFILKIYKNPISWKLFLNNHIAQGKWLFSVALLQWSSSNFFVLLSGIYLGIEALGALRLVQSFFGIINIVLQTVENYILPKVALIYNKSKTEAKKYLLKMSFFGAIMFGALLTILFIFSKEIIVLAGGTKYENYSYVVKIIAVLYFFIFLSYPVRIAVRVMVLNKIFFYGYLLSFIFSVCTFHFLLKYSGLYGAIAGLICNQIIMILYWQNQLKKNQFQLWK